MLEFLLQRGLYLQLNIKGNYKINIKNFLSLFYFHRFNKYLFFVQSNIREILYSNKIWVFTKYNINLWTADSNITKIKV